MISLWGAVGALLVSIVAPRPMARRLLWLGVGLTWASVAVLLFALIGLDFSLEYVARTTSRATPWPYRVSALWGGMEGSLLFYAALIVGIGAYGVRRHGRVEHTIVAGVGLGFVLLTALAANPFERVDIPAIDGIGLLAILQHPAMIYHPPILYLGLTALVVPFTLTVGSVWGGRLHLSQLVEVRRWLTWSWTWLAIGMVAGANWAYIELGWGGYWAWDPVENTALMPWLAITVFLHASKVYQLDGRLKRWTVLFALFPFALSVLGVYLTRSGVTGSIHAFAEDPLIGKVLLVASVVVTLVVAALVARSGSGRPWGSFGGGRDNWLAASVGLVAIALVFILVGSAYPAFLQVFWDTTVAVGASFFVTTVFPIALIIALLIGFGLHTNWSGPTIRLRDVVVYMLVATVVAVAGVVTAIEIVGAGVLLLAVASGSAAVLLTDLISRRHLRRLLPAVLAHLGMALILIGSGGSALGSEFSGPMNPGDSATIGAHVIELLDVNLGAADRYIYAEGVFLLDGTSELRPQVRAYENQGVPVAEPALRSTPMVDVIVAVTQLAPGAEGFEVSIYVRPMVWWVWLGAVVISLAGVAALRAGVVSRQRPMATAAPQVPGTTT